MNVGGIALMHMDGNFHSDQSVHCIFLLLCVLFYHLTYMICWLGASVACGMLYVAVIDTEISLPLRQISPRATK